MNAIITQLQNHPKFQEYIEEIKKKNNPVTISGLSSVGKIQYIYATKESINKPICIVTYNEIEAKRIVEDLKYFAEEFDQIYYFPKRELVTYDYIAESKDIPFARQEVLNKIEKKKAKIIVTTIEALMQKMVSKETLYKDKIQLKVGKNYSLEMIKQNLINLGYERSDLVEGKGSFSVRGDIIDVAISENEGIRIEFWGDEIDSIRVFNISTQRSKEMLQDVEIMPAHEFVLEDSITNIIQKIKEERINLNEEIEEKLSQKHKQEYTNKMLELKIQDIELIESGDYISKIEKYFNYFYTKQESFVEYLSEDFVIFYDEISKIKQRQDNILIENKNLMKALIEKEKYIPDSIKNIHRVKCEIEERTINNEKQAIYLEEQDFPINEISATKFRFKYRDLRYYKSEIEILIEDIIKWVNEKKKIVVLAGNKEEKEKFEKLLDEKTSQKGRFLLGTLSVEEGKLSEGFECYDLNLVVVTGDELFTTSYKKRRKLSSSFKQGEKVVFADLKIGDYVVHKSHGIGQFIGVNTLKADGITKDYIKIRYRNEDMLYIPTNDLDSIRKYIGGGESAPKINKLGSKEWENTKTKVKKNLQEVAKDLLELYAKRQKVKGFAFSKDTEWQKQFEESFPYTETEDQLRCIEETKKDMETQRPMDRLLCGDVGYRKNRSCNKSSF